MMREDLLNEIEIEFEAKRRKSEKEEASRRKRIMNEFPEIENILKEREELVFGTIRKILDGKSESADLSYKMNEINEKIENKLLAYGFPADYLSPVYSCKKCHDKGYIGETIREPCECLKKAYQEKIRDKIGLDREQAETFETYDETLVPDEEINGTGITQRQLTSIAREQCERWANLFPDVMQHDMLLTGGSGLGKTFLMRAMASRLIERGHNVLIVSAYTFIKLARKSYFDSENGVQELIEVPVLMIDDLGCEPLMQNITVEQLFYLLNERQSRNLSTIFSTNLTLQELRERYTERFVSRLNNPKRCLILTLAGRDLRKLER